MAVSVTHTFVSPVADAGNPNEVGPNEWNATHTLSGITSFAETYLDDTTQAATRTTLGVGTGDSPTFAAVNVTNITVTATASMGSVTFFPSGGVLNWNSGDVTITHSANALTVTGANNGYSFDSSLTAAVISVTGQATPGYRMVPTSGATVNGAMYQFGDTILWWNGSVNALQLSLVGTPKALAPGADDGTSLGSSGTAFSDLFLASGAVINFAAGNFTVTHSAGNLAFSGGLTVAGTVSVSGTTITGQLLVLATASLSGPVFCGGTVNVAATVSCSAVNTGSIAGSVVATQANQEAASSTSTVVTPGRQHFHPSAAKCWGYVTVSGGTPTLQTNFNITSITDTAAGRLTVTISTDFSTANYAIAIMAAAATAENEATYAQFSSRAAGSFEGRHSDGAGALADPADWNFIAFGDQ